MRMCLYSRQCKHRHLQMIKWMDNNSYKEKKNIRGRIVDADYFHIISMILSVKV